MKAAAGWPRGVASLVVDVECGGARHRVLWRRGSLVLLDHDAAADEVLAALGGDRPPCLEVRRAWRLGFVEAEIPGTSEGLVRSLSSIARWMSGAGTRPVVLPEPLRRLREASILHTWGRGLREADGAEESQQRFLERAVSRRVRDLAVADAERVARPWAPKQIDVGIEPFGGSVVTGRADDDGLVLTLRVPLRWLTTVWVRGLDVRSGSVVVAAAPIAGGFHLDVARWHADGDGGWELVVEREQS